MRPTTMSTTMPLPWPVMTFLARNPATRPMSAQTRTDPGSRVTVTSRSIAPPPYARSVRGCRAASHGHRHDFRDHTRDERIDDHRQHIGPDDEIAVRRVGGLEDAGKRRCECLPDREDEGGKANVVRPGGMKDEIQRQECDDDPGDQPDELNTRRSPRPDTRRGAAGACPGRRIGERLSRTIHAGLVRTVVGDRL